MKTRLALMVLLFAGCDEADDREAHPIVLPPVEPTAPREKSSGDDVSPLTPIVLPKDAKPPPTQPAPTPPPMQRTEVVAPVSAPPTTEPVEPAKAQVEAPGAAAPAITQEKPASPVLKKPPVKKTAKKKKR